MKLINRQVTLKLLLSFITTTIKRRLREDLNNESICNKRIRKMTSTIRERASKLATIISKNIIKWPHLIISAHVAAPLAGRLYSAELRGLAPREENYGSSIAESTGLGCLVAIASPVGWALAGALYEGLDKMGEALASPATLDAARRIMSQDYSVLLVPLPLIASNVLSGAIEYIRGPSTSLDIQN